MLNQPAFRDAPILVAGANFGCGSSREAAVWALMGAGLRCVIAPSFGDIFFNNCFQNGMLPVRLPSDDIARLADACAGGNARVSVDLHRQVVVFPHGEEVRFEIEPLRRDALLEGLDENRPDLEARRGDRSISSGRPHRPAICMAARRVAGLRLGELAHDPAQEP